MSDTTIWWLVTGGLVAIELTSGSFYLLMLASGAAAAALATYAGVGFTGQLVIAGGVGGLAVVWWSIYRKRHPGLGASSSPEQHLDIGETVQVEAWDEQGSADVKHRGANWKAVCADRHALQTGLHRIQGIEGNRLVLEKI
jgi:membrane protein implicated in regulation of membrane protease activity